MIRQFTRELQAEHGEAVSSDVALEMIDLCAKRQREKRRFREAAEAAKEFNGSLGRLRDAFEGWMID